MISVLEKTVDPDNFLAVVVILLLIAYFVYKELPEFKKRMTGNTISKQDAANAEIQKKFDNISKELSTIKDKMDEIDDRLKTDYAKIKSLEGITQKQQREINNCTRDNGMVLKSLGAILDGLEQQGCNHAVPETRKELFEYMTERTHEINIGG